MFAAGAGKHSRKTPDELVAIGNRVGFDGAALAQASRLVAKVDSAAVQDGFELYLHGFIVADDGNWVVVQQGMKRRQRTRAALSLASAKGSRASSSRPHAAIEGAEQGEIVNLTDARADAIAGDAGRVLGELGPDGIVARDGGAEWRSRSPSSDQLTLPHLVMPAHHDIRPRT